MDLTVSALNNHRYTKSAVIMTHNQKRKTVHMNLNGYSEQKITWFFISTFFFHDPYPKHHAKFNVIIEDL